MPSHSGCAALYESHGILKVGRSVDADCSTVGHSHLDAVAVLEPPELLKTLGHFKRRLRQGGNFLEHPSAVGVKTDVLEIRKT